MNFLDTIYKNPFGFNYEQYNHTPFGDYFLIKTIGVDSNDRYLLILPFHIHLNSFISQVNNGKSKHYKSNFDNPPPLGILENLILYEVLLKIKYNKGKLKSSNPNLYIINSFPFIIQWLTDFGYSSIGFIIPILKTLETNLGLNKVDKIAFNYCIECLSYFEDCIPEDYVCRKRIHGRDCRTKYYRDFISRNINRLDSLSDIIFSFVKLLNSSESKYGELDKKIMSEANAIANIFYKRLVFEGSVILKNDFKSLTSLQDERILPLSELEPGYVKFIKESERLLHEEVEDKLKSSKISSYRKNRLLREYFLKSVLGIKTL